MNFEQYSRAFPGGNIVDCGSNKKGLMLEIRKVKEKVTPQSKVETIAYNEC
jgi:hypothetical protein